LWYKWQSKYRWWKVRRSIKNGKFFKPFIGMKIKPTIPIDEIVQANQMTHTKETKLNWNWVDLPPMKPRKPLKAPTQETIDRLIKWHDENPVDFIKMHQETIDDKRSD
jgi:hypothetical protein